MPMDHNVNDVPFTRLILPLEETHALPDTVSPTCVRSEVPPVTVPLASSSVFLGLHPPWPGEVTVTLKIVVNPLLLQVSVPPVASDTAGAEADLSVFFCALVSGEHLPMVRVELAVPFALEHVIPEAAHAGADEPATATAVGMDSALAAARARIIRRIKVPL